MAPLGCNATGESPLGEGALLGMSRVNWERVESEDRLAVRVRHVRRTYPRSQAAATRCRAGFSLIELMVAISVLLIGTLAAFATQVSSGQIIDHSRDVTVAVGDLEMCMEELLLQSADDMPAVYPQGVPIPAFTGLHLRAEDITPTYPNWVPGDPTPDLLEVSLAATWLDSSGRLQRQTLLTAKSR